MRNELDFLIQLLEDENINWHSPIAHNVERDPTFNSHADSCLEEMGGFSIKLAFMWHVLFPDEICKRTIKYVKSGPHQIGINVLEFAAIIINYAAALTAIATSFHLVSTQNGLLEMKTKLPTPYHESNQRCQLTLLPSTTPTSSNHLNSNTPSCRIAEPSSPVNRYFRCSGGRS
jgi:hypothetical protein